MFFTNQKSVLDHPMPLLTTITFHDTVTWLRCNIFCGWNNHNWWSTLSLSSQTMLDPTITTMWKACCKHVIISWTNPLVIGAILFCFYEGASLCCLGRQTRTLSSLASSIGEAYWAWWNLLSTRQEKGLQRFISLGYTDHVTEQFLKHPHCMMKEQKNFTNFPTTPWCYKICVCPC
jgi:hypothetical protein